MPTIQPLKGNPPATSIRIVRAASPAVASSQPCSILAAAGDSPTPSRPLLGASLRPERKISVFFAAKSDCVDGTWQRSYIPKMVVIGVHTAAADSSSSSARNLSRRSRATRYPALVLALEIALVLALNHPGVLALSSSSSSGSSSGASRPRGRLLPCRVHAARRASVTPTRALLGGIRRRSRATYARQERLRGTP
jgi:hypothetical protein